MEPGDAATWAATALAFASGIGGLLFGVLGHRRAKRANDEAGRANELAMRALNAAEESNRLAKDANRLSEHANAVSGRALAKETEDWHVEWSCKWLGSASAVVLLNKGRDIAHNVQVVVIYESIHENREAEGDMRPGGRFEVFLPQISQRVSEHRARVLAIQRRLMDSSPNAPVGPEYQLEVTVSWKTGQGFSSRQSLVVYA